MANPLEAIPPVTLEEQALHRLREAILDDHFPPGSQINQVQVAALLGVSRGTVRAATRKLEEEGLVTNIPNRGTFVTVPDKKSIDDLYCVRAVLEAYGVKLAVERCTEEDIHRFISLVTDMQDAAKRGDTSELIRLDFLVHEFFIQLSGNSFLSDTWSIIKIHVRRALSFRHRSYPNLQEIADSHLPFIELLQKRRAEEAAKIMENHIHEARLDIIQHYVPKGSN